jgi:hypothetical protein
VRIWKEGINVFGVEYGGERIFIDCNLAPGEHYESPLHIDVKNVPYKLFQIIDTGEEDGFSPKSCMHTVIQWRHRALVQDSGVFGLGVPLFKLRLGQLATERAIHVQRAQRRAAQRD